METNDFWWLVFLLVIFTNKKEIEDGNESNGSENTTKPN